MRKGKLIEGLKSYFTVEIAIEYKACLYFFAILFFYCVCRMLHGNFQASILHMGEMITATYLMGYLQVYLMRNFDEADRLGKREFGCILFCTALYTTASWLFGWFERKGPATLAFAAFIALAYWCMYLVNKIKRAIDTEHLNSMLTKYKNQGRKEFSGDGEQGRQTVEEKGRTEDGPGSN